MTKAFEVQDLRSLREEIVQLRDQKAELLANLRKLEKERNQKRLQSTLNSSSSGSKIVIKNSNIVIDSTNVNIGTNPVYSEKDEYDNEMKEWTCQNCGAENVGEAIICESCGERNRNNLNLVSRVIEHEKFRKRFNKFRNQHPDLVKKFTRIEDKHHNQPGLGLGLSIVKEIVDRHNGKVWFESTINQGSKFFIQLSRRNQ